MHREGKIGTLTWLHSYSFKVIFMTMNQGICMQSEIQRCKAVGLCSLVGYSSVHLHVPGVQEKSLGFKWLLWICPSQVLQSPKRQHSMLPSQLTVSYTRSSHCLAANMLLSSLPMCT